MMQPHVEPPPIPLIKSKHENKSENYFVKIKFHRDPTSSSSDLYEFNMALFDNGEPEEFFLFLQKFNITHAASGTLATGAKIKYLCTLFHGEALRQIESFSADVEGVNLLNAEAIILGLALYFSL